MKSSHKDGEMASFFNPSYPSPPFCLKRDTAVWKNSDEVHTLAFCEGIWEYGFKRPLFIQPQRKRTTEENLYLFPETTQLQSENIQVTGVSKAFYLSKINHFKVKNRFFFFPR